MQRFVVGASKVVRGFVPGQTQVMKKLFCTDIESAALVETRDDVGLVVFARSKVKSKVCRGTLGS